MYYKTCRYRDRIVHWFFCKGEEDFLLFTLDRIGASERQIERMREIIAMQDSGFTFSGEKESVVYISTSSSRREFLNTYVHEIRHLTNDICSYYDIPLDSEESAYIAGELTECNFSYVHKLICSENDCID